MLYPAYSILMLCLSILTHSLTHVYPYTHNVMLYLTHTHALLALLAHTHIIHTMSTHVSHNDMLAQADAQADAHSCQNSSFRYAAYATRIRTLLVSAHRFVAYTSEVGESFRPVAHPYLVRGAYAISWSYILGDVSLEGYRAYQHSPAGIASAKALAKANKSKPENEQEGELTAAVKNMTSGLGNPLPKSYNAAVGDYRAVMLERAVFQSLASMALPAFTIHSVVKYSGKAMKGLQSVFLRTWGPVGVCFPFSPCTVALATLTDVTTRIAWVVGCPAASYSLR